MGQNLISNDDVVIAANEPIVHGATVDDSAGDIILRTSGVERARITKDGVGAGLLAGSQTFPKVWNPSGLRRWRSALGDALDGAATISCIGDSITVGVGSDGLTTTGNTTVGASTYRKSSWAAQLRRLFAQSYGTTGECWIGYGQTPGEFAGRITVAGGASGGTYGPFETGVKATSGQTITLATLDPCTQIDVYVWDGSSATTATYAVDGGGSQNLGSGSNNTNATTWTKRSITGLSSATHSVVITGPSSGTVFIAGFVALNQLTGVRVNVQAYAGYTTQNVLGNDSTNNANAGAKARSLAGIGAAPQADLVIVALGVNDFGFQNLTATSNASPGTDPTTYGANIQTIVNQIVATGACALLVGEPRQNSANYPSPLTYTEAAYWAQAKAVALATDHCAFVDIGEVWGSNVAGQALSLYTTASVHPTRKGHGDIGRIVHRVLTASYDEITAAA